MLITYLNAPHWLVLYGLSNFCGALFRRSAGVLINVVDTFYILRTGLINATAGIFLRRADSGDRSRQSFTVVSGLPRPSGHSALRGFEATDRSNSAGA